MKTIYKEVVGKLSIDEGMDIICEPQKVVVGKGYRSTDVRYPFITNLGEKCSIKVSTTRLRLFKRNGIMCAKCGIEGKYFLIEKNEPTAISPHLNLYAINEEGNEVLMTQDHIKPKSKGGKNHPQNLQVMCCNCNHKKGATYAE